MPEDPLKVFGDSVVLSVSMLAAYYSAPHPEMSGFVLAPQRMPQRY